MLGHVFVSFGSLVLLSAALAAPADNDKGVEYAPEGAGFKVVFKAKPKEQEQTHLGITIKMATLTEKDGAYIIGYSDVPLIGANETAEQTQTRLDGARDGALGNVNAKLSKEDKIILAKKHPGREIWADLPDKKGMLKMRMFIVKDRLYQIMAVGTKEFIEAEETDNFLKSLELTN